MIKTKSKIKFKGGEYVRIKSIGGLLVGRVIGSIPSLTDKTLYSVELIERLGADINVMRRQYTEDLMVNDDKNRNHERLYWNGMKKYHRQEMRRCAGKIEMDDAMLNKLTKEVGLLKKQI